MTGQEFLESMEYVDPKLIEAAENPPRRKSYRRIYLMTGAVAACAALVIGISAYSMYNRFSASPEVAIMRTAEVPAYEGVEEESEELPEAEMEMAEDTTSSGVKMAVVEGAKMNTEALDEVMITMLDEELKVKAEPDKTIKEIDFVIKDGSPTICVTITEEQAGILDQDELLSDSFDGDLTQYAAYVDERLAENGFAGTANGIVYIEGQTEPYRCFSAGEATTP